MHRDVVSHYRIKHFESLDCIINTIEDRFVQEDFRTSVKLENLLLKAAKGAVFDYNEYNDVRAIYRSDLVENRFQVQLETLQGYCASLDRNTCIRSVTDTLQNSTHETYFRATSDKYNERENIQFAEAN